MFEESVNSCPSPCRPGGTRLPQERGHPLESNNFMIFLDKSVPNRITFERASPLLWEPGAPWAAGWGARVHAFLKHPLPQIRHLTSKI